MTPKPKKLLRVPSLKLHKGTGQSYLWWQGKAKYFGKHGLPSTDKAYWRWRESLGPEYNGGRTVSELIALFEDAKNPNRQAKSRISNLRDALKGIGGMPANEYTPAVFREHRRQVASTGTRSARQVNDLMKYMRHIIKWGVGNGCVLPVIYTNLGFVERLGPHDVNKQPTERQPANPDDIYKTLPFLRDTPWAIISLLILTGARPSEICSLRKSEINRDGPHNTWTATLRSHKNATRGKKRFLVFNKDAQEILTEVIAKSSGDWVFPSEVLLDDHYQEASLRQTVGHACHAAGVKHWTPYQIRHMVATELAVDKGLEQAAAVLGHSDTRTTNIYQHKPDAWLLSRTGHVNQGAGKSSELLTELQTLASLHEKGLLTLEEFALAKKKLLET